MCHINILLRNTFLLLWIMPTYSEEEFKSNQFAELFLVLTLILITTMLTTETSTLITTLQQ